MSLIVRSGVLGLLLAGIVAADRVLAENEGLDDLDRATELKLTYSTLTDLGEVIRLSESALEKGLDEDNTRFATQLLASTRVKRGSIIAETIVATRPVDPRWRQFRRVALEDLEKGVELDPNQPQALYRIAQLNLLPEGDSKRALEAVSEAIRLSEDEFTFRAKALTLRAELREDPAERLADLDEAIRINPGDVATLRLRGTTYAEQEKYDQALADFDTALQIDPEHAATHELRAKVLIELKRYDEAMAGLDKARELAPQSVAPLMHQARIHGLKSDFKKALEVLNLANALQPADAAVLLLRASMYEELDQREKALADVDRVLELRPGLPLAMRFRVSLLAGSGEFDLAARQLEELQKAEPEDPAIELQLALFYSAEKQYGKAIQKFSAVLQKQPDNAIALRGRGDALLSMGRQADAIADYQKALKIEPDDTGALNNLAWVLATSPDEKLRDGKRAIELATKACELTEYKAAHILSTLGAGYAETGDFETAMKWSEKAIEIGAEDQMEPLKKELESYQAKKPVRELLNEPAEPEKPKPKEPEKPKPKEPEKPKAKEPEKPEAKEPEKMEPKEPEKPKPKAGEPEPSQPDKPKESPPKAPEPEKT